MTNGPHIEAVYQITCPADEIDQRAEAAMLEQSVEVPRKLIDMPSTEAQVRERFVGRVASIEPIPGPPDAPESFAAHIHYPAHLASQQLPQLINLIYGNISIQRGIKLVDLKLPDALLERFPGPSFGIGGIRAMVGVYGRPLLSTAIKPRGSSDEKFASIAERFALGGGDLIKDDHNLVDSGFESFRQRVAATQTGVDRANEKTGRRCLYLPNICGGYDAVMKRADAASRLGCAGVLISPMLVGMDTARRVAARGDLVVMSHPTFSGSLYTDPTHGIEPGVYLGTLMRLLGADASVYPNSGGRFGFTSDQCLDIAERLRGDHARWKGALPAPAGGMQLDSIEGMADQLGADAIFLIGGALLSHGDDLAAATREFLEAIQQHFDERLETPQAPSVSACEMPGATASGGQVVVEHLAFNDFTWVGRETEDYKSSEDGSKLPFKGVIRQELLGKAGEPMSFDLRYFEIEPGGHSSLEKHRHVHAVISVRGRGVLHSGGQRHELNHMDIAYVPSERVHQLRCDEGADEPFGFFCIVDRDRDRPVPPGD